MKYWQWSSESSCVRITRCISVSISSWGAAVRGCAALRGVIGCNSIYLDKVDLCECVERVWSEDVEDGDDVFVREVPEDLDLSEGAKTEHRVIKRCNALDGHLSARCAVDRTAHDPVRTLPQRRGQRRRRQRRG